MKELLLTGNQAVAHAVRNSGVEVVSAYPITPSTPVVEEIAKMVERGEMNARLILVESEHSAMSACIGASLGGVRAFTATSSHGLAYMHEMLHYAVNARTPVVMAVANRAIGPGWNIWADLSDSMSQRDVGWIQLYCESNQEIYDSIAMAYRVAEHEDVILPVMVCYDGFVLSHTSMPVKPDDLREFTGEYEPLWKVDFENPETHGNILPPDYFMELRYEICRSHAAALKIMERVEREFYETFSRRTPLIFESYRLDDADVAIVTAGAISSEAKIAVDSLREKGVRAGLLRIRCFRPLPSHRIVQALRDVERVYVFDRSVSVGSEGQIFQELRSSFYGFQSSPEICGYVVGLGGRDVTSEIFENAVTGRINSEWVMEVMV